MNFALVILTILVSAGISDGAQYYEKDGIKYFITYPMVHNWYEAMRYCIYNAMYPVSLQSYEEEQVVLDVIQNFKDQNNLTLTKIHFWTSGTDLGHNINEFYWTATGQPVIYKNWMHNNPSNGDGHAVFKTTMDCLLMNANYNYQWYDEFCELKYPVICQDKFRTPRKFNDHQCEL